MSNDSIPSDEDLCVATLQVLVDRPSGTSVSNAEIEKGVAARLDLSLKALAVPSSNERQTQVQRRAGWARVYLKHMHAIRKGERRGRWSATEHGRSLARSEEAVRSSYRKVRNQPTGTWESDEDD